jgi:tRNA-2-methylthio-N6-dimethylallyladenosine synthase
MNKGKNDKPAPTMGGDPSGSGAAPDSRRRRYYLETFGCQMNVNDSEKAAGLLQAEGYEPVDRAEAADVVFINTCAVREKAAEKLYHAVGRLKRVKTRRPGMVISVGGCVPQLEGPAVRDRAPSVDVVIGTHNIARLPELVRRARQGERGLVDLDRKAEPFTVPPLAVAHGSRVRAYVTAIEGCNHVCSFCVVPRTRGPEVCRPAADLVAEVESLVSRGYPEVMLLGQTVNAYSRDGLDFAGLLQRVAAVPGLQRLRFTTSHPEHVGSRLAEAFAAIPRLCPYLHLPVQSGSDRILASMRRGYTAAGYRATAALLRHHRPDLALSSDVIVGYPGETADDFQATVDLVEQMEFDGLFVFMYSPRPGTTALRLADDVPEKEKLRRLQVLNELQQRGQAARNACRVGSRQQVLVDTVAGPGRLAGRTPHFRIVHFEGPESLLGRLVTTTIEAAGPNALTGRVVVSGSLTDRSGAPIF